VDSNKDSQFDEPTKADSRSDSPGWLMRANPELARIFDQIAVACGRIEGKQSGDHVFSSTDKRHLYNKLEPFVDSDNVDPETMMPKNDT
jgi:hypothetical protein